MKPLSMSEDKVRTHVVEYFSRLVFIVALIGTLSAGCTRLELENKAEAYNAAIAGSTNELILLNAVRASQRAPMSFTGLGEVSAIPTFSGAAAGPFNFDPFGLTTYSLSPSVAVSGGFNTFTMSNLNTADFMKKIRDSADPKLIKYFEDLKWPEELLDLMFVASFEIKREDLARIERIGERTCATRSDPRTTFICQLIQEDRASLHAAGCSEFEEPRAVITLLNTGRDLCGMASFQIFLRTIRLLNIRPFHTRFLPYTSRSAQGMIYYLGELIAAQNYSIKPYLPTTYVGTAEGRRRVPLFVVRRGVPAAGEAAVRVSYNGEHFYIPRPEVGTADEARSLQVLDLVSQVITAQTSSKDLPKVNTIVVPR